MGSELGSRGWNLWVFLEMLVADVSSSSRTPGKGPTSPRRRWFRRTRQSPELEAVCRNCGHSEARHRERGVSLVYECDECTCSHDFRSGGHNWKER
jgi:hypothetical protein